MENRRFILIALLGVVLFFMFQAWQKDYAQTAPAPVASAAPAVTAPDEAPPSGAAPAGDAPTLASTEDPMPPAVPAAAGGVIRVETDVYSAEIALDGGDLRRLELKGYPVSKQQPELHQALLDNRDGRLFILQSGLAGSGAALASHKTRYRTATTEARLAEGSDTLNVVLETDDGAGLAVRKTYRFKRGSYQLDLVHELVNGSAAPVAASAYARLVRTLYKSGDEPPFVATFTGVGLYEQKEGSASYRFVKTSLEDLGEEPVERAQTGGWISILQHYFVAAILPPQGEALRFTAKPATQGYMAQYLGAPQTVAPGASASFTTALYLGPKLQKTIGAYAPGLELTVDYGILTAISEPLFWLLDKFHTLTGNWGWAIILLTIVVKLAMFKLSEAQYRSMAKMKKFAPRIQDIKERYGDDRERLQKAMMDLYKKEGFNPLAGCWPMLVQFPVFIALYWVLLESVEMRQAPFLLWLTDLSAPDPFYVLPVLFGISMFIQQKLSGQQVPDPMQQKIMNVMPIMLTAFFAFFQSGLVLYWFVSNLIGIGQQWFITRKLEMEEEIRAATKR